MHALVSNIAGYIFSPLCWIAVLCVLGYFFSKKSFKKVCYISAIAILLLFGNGFLLNEYAKSFQPNAPVLTPTDKYTCGIVAGGFASPAQDGTGYFNSNADRFIQAAKLFKQGHIQYILVSGGNGKQQMASFKEGAFVKEQFIILGITADRILIEDKSTNTKENAVNSRVLLDAVGLKPPYLLISAAHHLPRARLLFKKAGLNVTPYPCAYIAGVGIASAWDFLPNISVLLTWNVFLKETVALWLYR